MRIVFLLLVLANLGFWSWAHWLKPAPAVIEPYDGPGLTLLRELPADAALRVPRNPVAALPRSGDADVPELSASADAAERRGAESADAGAPALRRCVVVGPFTEPADADAAAELLAAQAVETNRFVGRDEIWDGYWVYIERIASRDEARAMLAELTDNGIADAYVIPDSDSGILISLGVFSEITRAGIQAERVNRLGFEATIADRMREAETTWLQMNVNDGTNVVALLQEPGRIKRIEQRDCGNGSDD